MQKTILLIDSSQILMEITRKIIEREGYAVHCAVGLAGARELLLDYCPDGIVMDSDLPDGSGFDLCQELRANSEIPIMLTSVNKEDELIALLNGASDFLKKPYDHEILKARLGVMLNTKASYGAEGDEEAETSRPAVVEMPDNMGLDINVVRRDYTRKSSGRGIQYGIKLSLAAAACVLAIVAGAGIYSSRIGKAGYMEIAEGAVPMAMLLAPEAGAQPFTGMAVEITEGPGYRIPIYREIIAAVDSDDVKMPLLNPAGNPCSLAFEVILADTGDTLYQSSLIEPGMCLDSFILRAPLQKGEHKATLSIRAYQLESLDEMNSTSLDFMLVVL